MRYIVAFSGQDRALVRSCATRLRLNRRRQLLKTRTVLSTGSSFKVATLAFVRSPPQTLAYIRQIVLDGDKFASKATMLAIPDNLFGWVVYLRSYEGPQQQKTAIVDIDLHVAISVSLTLINQLSKWAARTNTSASLRTSAQWPIAIADRVAR